MRRGTVTCLLLVGSVVALASLHAAEKDPIFVRWLVAGDPGDEAIREYWERSKNGTLSAAGEVDLGTMLFLRGYPKDAIRAFQRAVDLDPELPDAWLRTGLVHQRRGEVQQARRAYRKCLNIRPGSGWCNFYAGLLEEQEGHPSKALKLYRRAYKHAPELADPVINPEVLYSNLQLGAALRQSASERFENLAPLAYLEPDEMRRVRAPWEQTSVPTPVPGEKQATESHDGGSSSTAGAGTGTGAPSPAGSAARGVAAGSANRPGRPPANQPSAGQDVSGVVPRRPTSTQPSSGTGEKGDIPSFLHVPGASPETYLRPWWTPSWGVTDPAAV